MITLQFADHLVPYQRFIDDLSASIVFRLKTDFDDPEYMSQRTAYDVFGRANVDRWRSTGAITPRRRPGKLEYVTAELRLLQRTRCDYQSE